MGAGRPRRRRTSAVGKSWKTGKNGVPTATNVVEFKLKDTGTKSLNGKVAMELSPAKYGADEWWLLLEPGGVLSQLLCMVLYNVWAVQLYIWALYDTI